MISRNFYSNYCIWIQWIHKVGCVRIMRVFALQRLFPPFELVERSVNLDVTEKTVEIVILDSSNMTVQFHCRIQHKIPVFLINDKISSNYRLQILTIKSQKKCQKFPNFLGNKVKQITLKFSCKIHSSLRLFFIKEAKNCIIGSSGV